MAPLFDCPVLCVLLRGLLPEQDLVPLPTGQLKSGFLPGGVESPDVDGFAVSFFGFLCRPGVPLVGLGLQLDGLVVEGILEQALTLLTFLLAPPDDHFLFPRLLVQL